MSSRVRDRATMPQPVRLQLVESDLDDVDEQFVAFSKKMDTLNDRLSKILWALVGLLISVTTGCILYAATAVAK